MRWSLTYVATPIAVAVREALFTSSLTNSTSRGVQQSFPRTAWSWLVRLGSIRPSILDHPVLVLCLSGPCLWAPGWGEPGFRGGSCPGRVVFLISIESFVSPFHLQNGLCPNS